MPSNGVPQREQCVVYASRATEVFAPQDLEALAAHAAARNRAIHVSGVLIYSAGHFMQAVEGPAAQVDALLARIALDPRHQALRVLSRGAISGRCFAEWHMGVLQKDGRRDLDLDRLMTVAAMFDQCRGTGDLHHRARALLLEFRRLLPVPAA